MTDPRYLETLDPMPAEAGKWVYGKSLSELLSPLGDGRIPIGLPGGIATLDADGRTAQESTAAAVLYDNSESGLSAAYIQAAIDELAAAIIAATSGVASVAGISGIVSAAALKAALAYSASDVDAEQSGAVATAIAAHLAAANPHAQYAKKTIKVTNTIVGGAITPDADTGVLEAIGIAAALTINNPSGTPEDRDGFVAYFEDDGTSQSFTWGSKYANSRFAALPTATTEGKRHRLGFEYHASDDKLYCMYAEVEP